MNVTVPTICLTKTILSLIIYLVMIIVAHYKYKYIRK